MKLVYTATGKEVQIGDKTTTNTGQRVMVRHFAKPHKASSQGKVTVEGRHAAGASQEFYVSVIGAEWIMREDLGWEEGANMRCNACGMMYKGENPSDCPHCHSNSTELHTDRSIWEMSQSEIRAASVPVPDNAAVCKKCNWTFSGKAGDECPKCGGFKTFDPLAPTGNSTYAQDPPSNHKYEGEEPEISSACKHCGQGIEKHSEWKCYRSNGKGGWIGDVLLIQLAEGCDAGACNPHGIINSLADAIKTVSPSDLRNHPAFGIVIGQLDFLAGGSIGPSPEQYDKWNKFRANMA